MIWDIAVGVLIVAASSLGLFRTGLTIARHSSSRASNWIVSVLVALVVLYAVLIHGKLALAQILPFSNVIVVGNWIPLGAAMLAGIAGGQATVPLWRRVSLGLILAGLASYTLICDIGGAAPGAQDPWFLRGFCMQTSPGSCSACCAAGLLRHHGIPSSEREMIDLCLTHAQGTPPLGLYRGLKIKTRNTPWRVQVVRCRFEELIKTEPWPVLLLVSSDDTRIADATNPLRFRLSRRADHAIVVFGLTDDGEAVVGDPAMGHERWTLDKLKASWRGEGLRLVKRESWRDAEARMPRESLSKATRRRPS
jgi:predicted double-glycine peptidase